MGTLRDLLGEAPGAVLLVSPPDTALAEAATLKPRPSIASGMRTAEPATTIIWWPEADALTPSALNRLRWMLENGEGIGWIVLDPDEGLPPVAEVAPSLIEAGLRLQDERALPSGETAVEVRAV